MAYARLHRLRHQMMIASLLGQNSSVRASVQQLGLSQLHCTQSCRTRFQSQ